MEYTEIWIHWCTFFSRSWFNAPGFLRKLGVQLLYMRMLWISLNRGCFEVFPGDSVACSLVFFHATRWICCRYLLQGHQSPKRVTAAMTSGLRHRVGLVQRKLRWRCQSTTGCSSEAPGFADVRRVFVVVTCSNLLRGGTWFGGYPFFGAPWGTHFRRVLRILTLSWYLRHDVLGGSEPLRLAGCCAPNLTRSGAVEHVRFWVT